MNSPSKKIIQILAGNIAYCNFCLKDLREENSYCFEDEVTLESGGKSIKLYDLSNFIFGFQMLTFSASRILCRQCIDTIILSYKFIQMCRHNTEQLNNTVSVLERSIHKIVEEEDHKKTLFIFVDREIPNLTLQSESQSTFLTKYLFDIEPAPKNSYESLKSLQEIWNSGNKSPKSEATNQEYATDLNHFDASNAKDKLSKNIQQIKKRNRLKKIPLSEMIFDMNNMSQYKCKVCFKIYSNLYRLKQHFFRVHAPKDFLCTECPRGYGSAALLAQHKYDCHSSLMCSDCGKSYTSRSTFKTHVHSHQLKLICQICGKVFRNKRNFSKHIMMNICDRVLRKTQLEKKYECDYCSKNYSSKSTLRAHIKFEHGNGEAHVCSWCNKKFNAISRLTAHIVTHTQEKKFSCDVCGGRFVTKESLVYHTRIHTGEKPYQCEHCDKCFLSSSRRAEHVRRHHIDPMIECELCHSKFRSRSCLIRHKKRHFNPNSRLYYTRLISDDKKCAFNIVFK